MSVLSYRHRSDAGLTLAEGAALDSDNHLPSGSRVRIRSALLAAVVGSIMSLSLALGFLAANGWFGAGDLVAMATWTLPLAGLLYISIRSSIDRVSGLPVLQRYVALTLIGGLAGATWTFLASLLLGGWIGAFSFPVAICWMVSAFFAGSAAAWHSSPNTWRTAASFMFAVAVLFVGLTMYALVPERQVRVVMRPDSSHADEDRFWEEGVGRRTARGSSAHVLLEGISGVGVSGSEHGRPVFTVSFRQHLSKNKVDTMIAQLRRLPFVARVDTLPRR